MLHLVGSSETEYYAQLSLLWARGCVDALEERVRDSMEFVFAVVGPPKREKKKESKDLFDAQWSFPPDLSESSLCDAPKYRLSAVCD